MSFIKNLWQWIKGNLFPKRDAVYSLRWDKVDIDGSLRGHGLVNAYAAIKAG